MWREKEFDGLSPDGLRVLAALAERPDVTVRIAEHVVPHVERLVGPDSTLQTQRVAVRLATGISDEAGRLGSSDRDRWAARRALGDLTSVALTIHRSPEADLREAGLTLFESLLDVDPYTAQSAQRAVDGGLVAGDHSYRDRDVRRIREV